MNRFILLALLFAAAPLWAEAPLRTIEVSMMFRVCRDRIRIATSRGAKLTDTSTLADFGVRSEDLSGEVTDASNYGMYVESLKPPVIVMVYRKHLVFQDRDRNARLNLDTWALSEYSPSEVPVDIGLSIWPSARHDHALARQRYEERIRYEWMELLDAWPFLICGVAVACASLWGRRASRDAKVGVTLISVGCAMIAYVLVGSPPYHYAPESGAIVYAAVTGITLVAAGIFSVRPRTKNHAILHMIAGGVLSLFCGAVTTSGLESGMAGLAAIITVLVLLTGLSILRFKRTRTAQCLTEPA